MKKVIVKLFCILSFISVASCNSDKKILKLLNSDDKEDIILGAYKAGESGDKQFILLLLKNADDVRRSTNLQFKGISVYQSKMGALKKIFKQESPVKITHRPDSTVIKFYTELSQKPFNWAASAFYA